MGEEEGELSRISDIHDVRSWDNDLFSICPLQVELENAKTELEAKIQKRETQLDELSKSVKSFKVRETYTEAKHFRLTHIRTQSCVEMRLDFLPSSGPAGERVVGHRGRVHRRARHRGGGLGESSSAAEGKEAGRGEGGREPQTGSGSGDQPLPDDHL